MQLQALSGYASAQRSLAGVDVYLSVRKQTAFRQVPDSKQMFHMNPQCRERVH